ncbi:DUF4139 domain-containing protein [Paracraurococcus lichenis]|uniref:DUF4139 domain-containing protein n=1 Tax=Paracraurococcus lichenis TaxID=3064888 RepID=A0ABT9E2H5_9PROT|nr:DUF4139 domain-containing protein [Paracraurococcus sp. LOR1-02]MDO9710300.1 DUF4139 domain-containing protein [Paracraurococcus sp. LOR1-02]
MRALLLATTLALPAAALPAAAADLPVRSVTLSNAGLMQVEHAGALAPDAAITLRVPLDSVDDLLKSLLLRDPAGRVEEVRLAAQDLEAEAFHGLPLRPGDFESRASLMRALRGQAVKAGGAEGRLMDAEDTEAGLRLTLLTPGGLRLLLLREGEEVALADAALAGLIARAAEAMAASRSADTREVTIRLSGATAAREVGLTYVAAAPLWKPSWRLVLPDAAGQARLQGWAVVENRSGADWEGVRLSLVSGNPAAFAQALYAPVRVARPEVPVRAAERVTVEADTGPRPVPAPAAAMLATAARAKEAGAPPPPLAALPEAAADSAAGRVAFTLPRPVSIRGGETANLPFLDAALPAEPLWWVQDLSARHPLNAVRLANATDRVLPDGLAAVYAAGGAWLGDAELRAMPPGEQRILAYARDREVQVTTANQDGERPTGITLRRGTVVIALARRAETALAIDPRGARGRLAVDLPRREGWTPLFPVVAQGDFGLRTEAMLDGAAATLRFAWERAMEREVPLWDAGLGDPRLLRWRDIDLDAQLRRLPGGPGTLEALRSVLERLPAEAPGRAALAEVVESLGEARRLLDAARTAIRAHALAAAALERARAAVEDRSGAAKEEARRRLTEASLAAERSGAAADAAWEAWQRQVQAVMSRAG